MKMGLSFLSPNDRDKYALKLEQAGKLMSLSEVISLSPKELSEQAIKVYPQLRSFFRFLAEQNRLYTWYDKYIEDFDEDPTGSGTLQFVFDLPLEDIHAKWKKWLLSQPIIEHKSLVNKSPTPDQIDPNNKAITR